MNTDDLLAAKIRHDRQTVELRWFFVALLARYSPSDAWSVLEAMRDAGLKLRAAPGGCVGHSLPIHAGDLSAALAKVRHADFPGKGDAADNWRKVTVTVCAGTREAYRQEVGTLVVHELDVAEACEQMGARSYPWPKMIPPAPDDIEDRVIIPSPAKPAPHDPPPERESDDPCITSQPKNRDEWYYLIRDAARTFFQKHGTCPNATQLWAQLIKNPPIEYGVEVKMRDGKSVLLMAGDELDKRPCEQRWRRYTEPNEAQE